MDYQDQILLPGSGIRMHRDEIQLDLIVYYRHQGRLHFVHTASGKDTTSMTGLSSAIYL